MHSSLPIEGPLLCPCPSFSATLLWNAALPNLLRPPALRFPPVRVGAPTQRLLLAPPPPFDPDPRLGGVCSEPRPFLPTPPSQVISICLQALNASYVTSEPLSPALSHLPGIPDVQMQLPIDVAHQLPEDHLRLGPNRTTSLPHLYFPASLHPCERHPPLTQVLKPNSRGSHGSPSFPHSPLAAQDGVLSCALLSGDQDTPTDRDLLAGILPPLLASPRLLPGEQPAEVLQMLKMFRQFLLLCSNLQGKESEQECLSLSYV